MTLLKHLNSQGNISCSSSIVVFCSAYRKNLKLYEFYIPRKILPFQSNAWNISLYLEAVSLLIWKICLSVELNFWKTPLKITAKNLRSFQGTYLWRSSILVKALSLRFTVVFLLILKLKVLRNFIIILSALAGNFFFFFLSIPFTVVDYDYSIILLFYSITGYILLLYYSCEDISNKLPKIKRLNYIKSD